MHTMKWEQMIKRNFTWMPFKKWILEYKRPYEELKEDVVVHILVLKEDITWLLEVHSIDQGYRAVITIGLYVVSTRDPRRAVETKPFHVSIQKPLLFTSSITDLKAALSTKHGRGVWSACGPQRPTPLLEKRFMSYGTQLPKIMVRLCN